MNEDIIQKDQDADRRQRIFDRYFPRFHKQAEQQSSIDQVQYDRWPRLPPVVPKEHLGLAKIEQFYILIFEVELEPPREEELVYGENDQVSDRHRNDGAEKAQFEPKDEHEVDQALHDEAEYLRVLLRFFEATLDQEGSLEVDQCFQVHIDQSEEDVPLHLSGEWL